MSAKLPAIQFYPGDWYREPGLKFCTLEERGAWFELLLLMHDSEERGKLILNGVPMSDDYVAIALNIDIEKFKQIRSKLLNTCVASIDEDTGALCNRRMLRDNNLRKARAQAGQKGGSKRQAKPKQNIPPSSSSSSSSSYIPKKKEDTSDKSSPGNPKELRINPPSLADVKNAAATTGISHEECEKFFYHFDKVGWIDRNGNPLTSLPSALASWKIKGAEIKATSTAIARSPPKTGQDMGQPPKRQIWQIQADIDNLKKTRTALNERRRFEYGENRTKYANDWDAHQKIGKQIEDLQKELSQ